MAPEPSHDDLLLSLARRSIGEGLGRPAAPSPPIPAEDWAMPLLQPAASFVTLKRLGLLRGCRGLLEPVRPLFEDVWLNAWSSAYEDPRFPPLAASEVDDLDIAISVLSALEPIVGRDRARVARPGGPGPARPGAGTRAAPCHLPATGLVVAAGSAKVRGRAEGQGGAAA